jgi:hypothetical protein
MSSLLNEWQHRYHRSANRNAVAMSATGNPRRCLAIPDGTFVISIVFMSMLFTYFVIPLGIPDASLFRNGIPNDGYVIGSIIFQWMALMVALTLYYPRSQRMYTLPRGSMCATGYFEDEFGTSLSPITTVMLTYAVIKLFSFFGAVASKTSTIETQRLVRTVLALSELIILYLYVYNMHEAARQKYVERKRMAGAGRSTNARGGYEYLNNNVTDQTEEVLRYLATHRR